MTKIVTDTFGLADQLVKDYGHDDITAYQKFYGLKQDGIAGPVTTGLLHSRFCAVPDFAGGAEANWPRTCMSRDWAYKFSKMNLTDSQIAQAVTIAHAHLNKMSGAKINLVASLEAANIWATSGGLNGGTLAWSMLPNGSCNDRLEQRYDNTSRTWNVDMLAKVIVHECLHAYGLEHSNDQRDIMYPSINPNTTLNDYPGPGDLARMVRAYGPYTGPVDPPDPDPDPSRANKLVADIQGLLDAFKAGSIPSVPGNDNGGPSGDTFGL